VEPSRLELSTFSGERELRILARIEPGAEPVVVIRGPEAAEAFNRKERAGPFWLNADRVRVAGAPALLLTFTRAPLGAIVHPADIDRWKLDAGAVRRVMLVTPAAGDIPAVRDSYVALKMRRGAFLAAHGEPARIQPGAAPGVWVCRASWPRTAPPAEYTVTIYQAEHGRITGSAAAPLAVAHAGLSAWLAQESRRHGLAYGAIAVLVALSLGFGIDFLVTLARRMNAREWPRGRGHKDAALSAPGKLATTDHVRR
jgi:hypothetical protein